MATITDYTNLVTSEHSDKPKYMAMIGVTLQHTVDLVNLLDSIPSLYDIDGAVGQQLDVCGEFVGVSRHLTGPLTGVYFAFDEPALGFDLGVWKGPFDPSTGLTSLPDDFYRVLIKARILNNQWNGSKEDAYVLAQAIFSVLGYTILIEDYADLTMGLGIVGAAPPIALVQQLLVSGKFDIKPAGVRVVEYFWQSVAGPIFAFDNNNAQLAGFDVGGWATIVNI